MTQEHPITPPPELVREWQATGPRHPQRFFDYFATQAARWGADQELEACCEWLQDPDLNVDAYKLRAARRPKPPSLKQQALKLVSDYGVPFYRYTAEQTETIRRALEALPDD